MPYSTHCTYLYDFYNLVLFCLAYTCLPTDSHLFLPLPQELLYQFLRHHGLSHAKYLTYPSLNHCPIRRLSGGVAHHSPYSCKADLSGSYNSPHLCSCSNYPAPILPAFARPPEPPPPCSPSQKSNTYPPPPLNREHRIGTATAVQPNIPDFHHG